MWYYGGWNGHPQGVHVRTASVVSISDIANQTVPEGTTVGPLSTDAAANPILDRDGAVYVGLVDGVGSVDQCGERRWMRHDLGSPTWRAAASLPGKIFAPIGDRVVALDGRNGTTIGEISLADLPHPAGTSSTATVTVSIADMAVRGSGGLVVSVIQRVSSPRTSREVGLLVEIDRNLIIATVFRRLGPTIARRVVVDRDEALVVVTTDGDHDRLVRFGLDGLPSTSWSTAATSTAADDD